MWLWPHISFLFSYLFWLSSLQKRKLIRWHFSSQTFAETKALLGRRRRICSSQIHLNSVFSLPVIPSRNLGTGARSRSWCYAELARSTTLWREWGRPSGLEELGAALGKSHRRSSLTGLITPIFLTWLIWMPFELCATPSCKEKENWSYTMCVDGESGKATSCHNHHIFFHSRHQ